MTRCLNANCNHEIDPSWKFCAHCGTDNRPPENRFPVIDCPHQSMMVDRYCTDCGADLAPNTMSAADHTYYQNRAYNSDYDGTEDLTSSSYGPGRDTSLGGCLSDIGCVVWTLGCLGWLVATSLAVGLVALFFSFG